MYVCNVPYSLLLLSTLSQAGHSSKLRRSPRNGMACARIRDNRRYRELEYGIQELRIANTGFENPIFEKTDFRNPRTAI